MVLKAWTKQLKILFCIFFGTRLDCILGVVLCRYQTLWIGQALCRARMLVFMFSSLFLVFWLLCICCVYLLVFMFNTIFTYLSKKIRSLMDIELNFSLTGSIFKFNNHKKLKYTSLLHSSLSNVFLKLPPHKIGCQ